MSRNTYLVMASNSFSGSWMVDTIMTADPESRVVGMSRQPEKNDLFLPYQSRNFKDWQFYQIDVNKDMEKMYALLDEIKPNYVINFAAQGEVGTSWKYPEQWFETNTVGTVKLTNHLKGKDYLRRYVHISTPEVYGSCDNVIEDAPLKPSTPYAASKAAGDLFIFTLVKHYGFPMVMIRSTNVYGKHQQLYRIIPRTAIYLKLGKKVPLQGGGKAIKSYIHIKDVCEGILAALRKGRNGEIYHFSPDDSISIHDLVKKVCELMGYDFSRSVEVVGERAGQDSRYVIDSSKARKELGWAPKISFEEGLREAVEWIKDNYERIIKEPLDYVHIPS